MTSHARFLSALLLSCLLAAHPFLAVAQTPMFSNSAEDLWLSEVYQRPLARHEFRILDEQADKIGISKQRRVEAALVNAVRSRDPDWCRALLKEADPTWPRNQFAAHPLEGQFEGLLHWAKAVVAFGNEDLASVNSQTLKAFDQSPLMGSELGDFLFEVRDELKFSKVVVPLTNTVFEVNRGTNTTLRAVLADDDFLVVCFWDPSSSQSVGWLPTLDSMRSTLKQFGGVVVAFEKTGSSSVAKDAFDRLKIKTPCLIDSSEAYVPLLQVDETPQCYIINEEGRIRYHGPTDDARFALALMKLGVPPEGTEFAVAPDSDMEAPAPTNNAPLPAETLSSAPQASANPSSPPTAPANTNSPTTAPSHRYRAP